MYANFLVDNTVRFLAIANIRGALNVQPSSARLNKPPIFVAI